MSKTRQVFLLLITLLSWVGTTASLKAAVFDLSSDFSTSVNPNGVWTFGWKSNVTDVIVPFAFNRTVTGGRGTFFVWARFSNDESAVQKNIGTEAGNLGPGEGLILPGQVMFVPGNDGNSDNFGAIRFTAPSNGVYAVACDVRGADAVFGDSDFHVVRDATELFSAQIPASSLTVTNGSGYTNTLTLAAGETLDFLIGRGLEPHVSGSPLKIKLTITASPQADTAPNIVAHPANTVVALNSSFSFNVLVEGSAPLKYQWYFNSNAIANATNTSYSGTATNSALSGFYQVIITNSFGSVTSSVASLAIRPGITTQPISKVVVVGRSFVFNTVVQGSAPLTYQWYFNSNVIANATNATFASQATNLASSGFYHVIVTNFFGSVTSSVASLSVVYTNRYDASGDFSTINNPGGAWSYGWKGSLGGAFTPLTFPRQISSDNGVPIFSWEFGAAVPPVVSYVLGPGTAVSAGGQFVGPPGTLYFGPGADGDSKNFGVVRFAVLPGQAGTYRIETSVSDIFDGASQGDTDFHVMHNGEELFWQFLPAHTTAGYTNLLDLLDGDTVDFMIGRGLDGINQGGLKLAATLVLTTNAVQSNVFDLSSDFSTSVNPNGVWTFGWKSNVTDVIVPFTFNRTVTGGGGTFFVWARFSNDESAVQKNIGTEAGNLGPGEGLILPGQVMFVPGNDGNSDNFGAIRFTAPSNGVYAVACDVRGADAVFGDSDFHVVRDATELFSAQIPASSLTVTNGSGYTNTLTLAAGETLDFLIGRGLEPHVSGSPLKIKLTITASPQADTAPNIVAHPANTVVALNSSFSFNVLVEGSAPLKYQWYFNSNAIANATNTSYSGTATNSALSGFYQVIITNSFGSVTSSVASLAIRPGITTQPIGQTVGLTANFSFSVVADGSGPLKYQWYFNGNVIANATNTSYASTATNLAQGGSFRVIVTNSYGSVTSQLASLAITSAPPVVTTNVFDLSSDFSTSVNPNGVWMFGWKTNVTGVAVPFTIIQPDTSIFVTWARFFNDASAVQKNVSSQPFNGGPGEGLILPGEVRIMPGNDGRDDNFGLIRFTAPSNGVYAILCDVRGSDAPFGDADFHVVRSGTELFSAQIPPSSLTVTNGSGYTNSLSLAAGETVDFLAGRGLDGHLAGSVLKIKLTITSSPLLSCTPPAASLAVWWKGESNLVDTVSGNNGTGQNGLSWTNGQVGKAFLFDGVNDYATVPASESLNVGSGTGLTVEMWIKPDQIATAMPLVEWTTASAQGSHFWIDSGTGTRGLYANLLDTNGVAHTFASPGDILTTSAFQHVALTYDKASGVGRIYLNGAVVASNNIGTFVPQTSTGLNLGKRTAGLGNGIIYKGLMDEISLYNTALSQTQIQDIFNAGSNGKCDLVPVTNLLVVPNSLRTNDFAFGAGTLKFPMRSQQVYGSSQFPAGPIQIQQIRFRPDRQYGNAFTSTVPNLQVSLSTTTRATQGLSAIFADNVGADNTVVFNGSVNLSSTFTGPALGPKEFDIIINLQTPFTYNPANGNLLLETRNGSNTGVSLVSGHSSDSAVSRVFSSNPDGLTGSVNSTSADAVQLVYVTTGSSMPSITMQPTNQAVALNSAFGFSVIAQGSPTLKYQWYFNSNVIANATNTSFTSTATNSSQSGFYHVIVTNSFGSVTSSVVTLTVFTPRTLALQTQPQSQEGTRVQIPIALTSTGDIAGMTFVVPYNTNYLRDLNFGWDPLVQGGFNQVNQNPPGVVSASFVLSDSIPGGTQPLATLDFLLRSVPANLDTVLTLTLLDTSDPLGNSIPINSTVVQGCTQRILVRRIIGDNNANDRLDVGDATVILRLLTVLDPVRSWDRTGNDVNQNSSLDSGDLTKVLRVAAGIDPQPTVPLGISKIHLSGSAPVSAFLQPSGQFVLTPDRTNGTPGQQVKVQVRLQNTADVISATAFTLNYPTNALRLENSSAYHLGSLVPGGTLAQWNVSPSQNNFATQNGHVTLAASSATPWPTSSGVIAEFTFTIQAGATSQYLWPISVTSAETAATGFDNRLFPTATAAFIGRVPIAGQLSSPVIPGSGQYQFSFTGDAGGTYAVDASTDLITWIPIQTNSVPAGGSLQVQDPVNGQPHRFYRVRSLY